MWEFNRTERKALVTAAGLIGLSAVGRITATGDPGGLRWIAAPVEEAAHSDAKRLAGDLEGLRRDVSATMRREERARTPLGPGERIDPNTADEVELRRLPGIGPALAAAIIEERLRRRFGKPEDVQHVPGIGPATYARLAPHLALSAADPVGARGPPPSGRIAPGCGPASTRVDLNRATEAELRALPGIGPVLARRIVQMRQAEGAFLTPDSLVRVPGIGPRLLDRLRDRLCISAG